MSLQGGELAFEKGTRIALHDQRPPAGERQAAARLRPRRHGRPRRGRDGAARARAGDGRRRRTTRGRWRRYSDAQARLEHAGGYDWRDRAAAVVRGLGFTDDDLDRPLSTFSGGELTRASLARALAAQPDLLLLDEPTNHLDIESIEWLEELLKTIDAAVILVAHDRWFLEAVTTAVLELDRGRSIFFPGTVARVAARAGGAGAPRREDGRAAGRGHRAPRAVRRAVPREEHEGASRRSRSRSRSTGSRRSRSRPAPPRRTLGFEFLKPARSGRVVVEARGLDLRAGDEGAAARRVVRARARRARRRSSARTAPARRRCSRRSSAGASPRRAGSRLGHGVEVAYFSQHEVELDERGSVLDATMAATGLRRPEAQTLLGRFLFSGWDAHEKPVTVLSGGERRRLALALVVASGANFLVLDEPTNHLDVESREALEAALEAFPGTVLLVSHDRALLDAVVGPRRSRSRTARSISYAGGWAEYVRRDDAEPAAAPPPKPPKPKARSRRGRSASAAGADAARARRARDRPRRGARRRARAAARGGLDERRPRLGAPRARDDLDALLARWEALFDDAQA